MKRVERKKHRTKKEIETVVNNDFMLFTVLLSTIAIVLTAIRPYTFAFMKADISFSVFLFPPALFMSNYITKKIGYKNSFLAILISSLIVVLFSIVTYDFVGKKIDYLLVLSHSVSYFVSMFVNLTVYYYIIINLEKDKSFILIFFSYLFAVLINFIIYMFFMISINEYFWDAYCISIIIQTIISVFLVMIDMRIERGV